MIDPQSIYIVYAHASGKRETPRRAQSMAASPFRPALLYLCQVKLKLIWIKFPRSTMALNGSVANLQQGQFVGNFCALTRSGMTMIAFKGSHFEREVILGYVR